MAAALICILGIWIFYPLVMRLGFSQEWLNSIPTSRYMLPYLFAALAVSPLTVIELIFGSKRYFLRIQIEQLLIIIVAFIALPELGQRYEIALLTFSVDQHSLSVHSVENEQAGATALPAGAENMQLNTGRYLEYSR
jgi:uncharacterized membrane protein